MRKINYRQRGKYGRCTRVSWRAVYDNYISPFRGHKWLEPGITWCITDDTIGVPVKSNKVYWEYTVSSYENK